jgi:hypothetical protein
MRELNSHEVKAVHGGLFFSVPTMQSFIQSGNPFLILLAEAEVNMIQQIVQRGAAAAIDGMGTGIYIIP